MNIALIYYTRTIRNSNPENTHVLLTTGSSKSTGQRIKALSIHPSPLLVLLVLLQLKMILLLPEVRISLILNSKLVFMGH